MSNKVEPDKVSRRLSHRRDIQCVGYKRSDGFWDIEATLIDTKGITISTPDRLTIPVGEELHEMSLCLTLDNSYKVLAVSVKMNNTPYSTCSDIESSYQQLVGERIANGWGRTVRTLFGDVKGCTHLGDLLKVIATVAYQTLTDELQSVAGEGQAPEAFKAMINTCHSLDETGDIVGRLWPEDFNSNANVEESTP